MWLEPVVRFSTHKVSAHEGMLAISMQHPSPPFEPVWRLSSLWTEWREPLWFCPLCPLEFNSYLSWSGLTCLCHYSPLLPSLWWTRGLLRGASEIKLQWGFHRAWQSQIWGEDGIYGMACQVGISARLYRTKASHATYLTQRQTLPEFKNAEPQARWH